MGPQGQHKLPTSQPASSTSRHQTEGIQRTWCESGVICTHRTSHATVHLRSLDPKMCTTVISLYDKLMDLWCWVSMPQRAEIFWEVLEWIERKSSLTGISENWEPSTIRTWLVARSCGKYLCMPAGHKWRDSVWSVSISSSQKCYCFIGCIWHLQTLPPRMHILKYGYSWIHVSQFGPPQTYPTMTFQPVPVCFM